MQKRNKMKICAVTLILAMVICGINVINSNAASKITLKSGKAAPATVYVGKSYSLIVSGTKVKFTSSNKKVATIGATFLLLER